MSLPGHVEDLAVVEAAAILASAIFAVGVLDTRRTDPGRRSDSWHISRRSGFRKSKSPVNFLTFDRKNI